MSKRPPAPSSSRFVVVSASDRLPKARVLSTSAPLTLDDGGDGNPVTLGVGGADGSTRGVVRLSGQLGGSADAPDVRGLRVPGPTSPTLLALGNVADGQALVRSGTSVVGGAVLGTSGGTMTGDIAMGGHKVTGLASGSATDDAATYGQLASMLNGLDWQASVLRADLNAPPGSPSSGDRYVVATSPTGAWSGHANAIAVYGGSAWTFLTPTKGTTTNVEGGTGAGTDIYFNGTNWVNIGASVDHGATLNRSADDAHSQYQLGSAKDQNNGYAGLDGGGLVNKSVKAIRTSSDPGSPTPGEVWVNGVDLKYRNNNGGGAQTDTVERQANKDANNGYASLDGGGLVNKSVKAIRTSGDPGSPNPGEVWVNGVDLKYRNNNGGGAQTDTVERQANKDANSGYAGLDSGGLVNRAIKTIRTGSDPGSPNPGDVWVNGVDLKYRNNNGGGAQTETIERQVNKDANTGYAGLDGGGLVNKAVKTIRTGGDPGSPNPGDVWVNGVDLKYRDNGGSPATRVVVPATRQVSPGAGLVGGGDLTADRTLQIAAFSGVLSKELAANTYTFSASQILTHITYDAGADGMLLPTAIRLPPRANSALETRALLVFDDNSSVLLANISDSSVDFDLQTLANALTGDLSVGSANNGRSLRKIAFETRNTTGGSVGTTTVGPFRLRGLVFPRGGGMAL